MLPTLFDRSGVGEERSHSHDPSVSDGDAEGQEVTVGLLISRQASWAVTLKAARRLGLHFLDWGAPS